MKKHALILGTITSQAEAMQWLKQNGWHVSACGHVQEGPGVDIADHFYLVDILDIPKVKELAHKIRADVVYSVGSDIAMPTIARVSELLGLPCFFDHETVEIMHKKLLTRQFLNTHNLSTTNFKKVTSIDDFLGFTFFPAIIKPADSQGQRGVYIVKNREEASQMLPESLSASRNREAIIEELIQGPEISVHAFVVDSELKLFLPSDRHVWDGPAVGVPTGHVIPSRFLSRADLPIVKQLVQSCIQRLGITNGPLYFQMKICPEYGPKIIEIAPRLDGCHLWRLVEFYTGVNLIKACFDSLSGLPWQHSDACEPSKSFSLWFHLQKTGDAFMKGLHSIPEGANCVHEQFLYHEGQTVRFTNGTIEKVGYYILQDPEQSAAEVE